MSGTNMATLFNQRTPMALLDYLIAHEHFQSNPIRLPDDKNVLQTASARRLAAWAVHHSGYGLKDTSLEMVCHVLVREGCLATPVTGHLYVTEKGRKLYGRMTPHVSDYLRKKVPDPTATPAITQFMGKEAPSGRRERTQAATPTALQEVVGLELAAMEREAEASVALDRDPEPTTPSAGPPSELPEDHYRKLADELLVRVAEMLAGPPAADPKELAEAEGQIAELRDRLRSLQQALEATRQEMGSVKARNAELQRDATSRDAEIAGLKVALGRANNQVGELRNERDSLATKVRHTGDSIRSRLDDRAVKSLDRLMRSLPVAREDVRED